jgi:hypothetical protein
MEHHEGLDSEHLPDKGNPSYDRLREQVQQAWIHSFDRLAALLAEMPLRCQAVIDADGMHTQF